ncbi:MAG: N-acetylmuramoyl-L-alanine amidase [Firmicutes bacterium]|nr:N-acetylmuramoyl-L-alanine amidase [Bacillota bacterium]
MFKNTKFIVIKINRKYIKLFIFIIVMILILLISKNLLVISTIKEMEIKRVVLDPGHGGIDGGTSDNYGLLEKNINLDFSLKLKKYILKSNNEVLMTRKKDVSLEDKCNINASRYIRDLTARKNIINRKNNDIFISIHTNSNPKNPHAKGVLIFYYKKSSKGKKLAEYISKSINNLVFNEMSSHKVYVIPADYFILRETTKPGVLIEIGYITNYQDKKLLQNDDYKNSLAQAISYGIYNYFHQNKYKPFFSFTKR